MNDLVQAAVWAGVLGGGLGVCVVLKARGLATTHVRDLLHVGAGVWVLGWRFWRAPLVPVAITVAAAIAVAIVPRLARRTRLLADFRDSVSDDDERWLGLSLYSAAFALGTLAGLYGPAQPAAAALWSLTLGDGIGGAFGRRFGHHAFAVPGGKRKSLEGSLAVALFAAAGAMAAAWWFGGPSHALLVGAVAAAAEALSPRGSDNLIVPAAVYAVLRGVS